MRPPPFLWRQRFFITRPAPVLHQVEKHWLLLERLDLIMFGCGLVEAAKVRCAGLTVESGGREGSWGNGDGET